MAKPVWLSPVTVRRGIGEAAIEPTTPTRALIILVVHRKASDLLIEKGVETAET